jgi:imidazoleglycerol phosphate synthase glutamine amidotransferase subunit HisH
MQNEFKLDNIRSLVSRSAALARDVDAPLMQVAVGKKVLSQSQFKEFEPAELTDEQCQALNARAPKNLTILPHVGWDD